MKKVFKSFKLIFLSLVVLLLTATLLSCFKRVYKITFLNYNGEVLEVASTFKDEMPVYGGETPTKAKDQQYTYVFDGWNPELKAATEDATYRATFKKITNTYTVSFDVEGVKAQEVAYGARAFKPIDPEKAGYEFKGWYDGDTLYDFNLPISGNLSLKAKWNIIEYTITYDLADGALPSGKTNPTTYTVETDTFTLNNPEKSGYTFTGWTSSMITTPTKEVTISKGSVGNLSFTANYEKNVFTVTFDVDGIESQELSYGAKAAKPTDPTKIGYEFGGWYNGEDLFDFDTPITSNIDLKAKWNLVEYTITYDLAEGSLPDGKTNPTKYTVESDTFTLNNPEKTGYTFTGWTYGDITTPTLTVAVNKGTVGNLAFTANYSINKYTVTFDVEGIASLEVEYNTKATKPTDPTKLGYEFGGWYNGEDLFDFDTPITSNIELQAKWNLVEYTITYDLAEGSLPEGKTNPANYTVESDDFTLNNPEKTGYTFIGWTYGNVTTPTKEVTIEKGSIGDLAFTANYSINKYTVTFDVDGIDSQEVEYNAKATKPTDPTKIGYEFSGWLNGEDLFDFDTPITSNIDLKAKWNLVEYFITYNLAEGTLPAGKTNPAKYTVETDDFTLNNPEKTGYTFTGWTGTGLDFANLNVTIEKGTTGDLSFTANYSINKYIVTFDVEGIASLEVEYNTKATKPTDPTKLGYEFGGWYNGEDLFDFDTPITSNIDLKAKWNLVEYTITYTLNGGTVETDNPTTYTVETVTFTLNNPAKVGYTFDGWTGTNLETKTLDITIEKGRTGDLSFTANYEIITYSITYTLNGGTVDVANPDTYTVETPTFTLNNPAKVGYTFDGWTGTNLETKTLDVTIEKGRTGDLSFTANYEIITYNITYTLNGGTVDVANPDTYTVETPTFTLNNPTKTGYIFDGWTGNGKTTPTTTMIITIGTTDDIAFVAHFTPITYTINFNKNNESATGSMDPQDLTYDLEEELSDINFTRTDYKFIGWALSSTGEVVYNDGQVVLNLSSIDGDVINLYAIWKMSIQSASIRNTIQITENNVEVTDNTYLYDGIEKTPVVSITGLTQGDDEDYIIQYSNNINAGTATITITGVNDYTGVIEKTFKINQVEVSLTWAENEYTYNGEVQTVEVSFIGINSQKIILTPVVTQLSELSTQVETTFRNAGKYRITVTLDENYSNYKLAESSEYTIEGTSAYIDNYLIKKATLNVNYGITTFEYDGTQKSLTETTFNIISGKYENDDVSVTGINYKDNVRIDATSYKFDCVLDGEDKDNYEASGEIEITRKVVSVTWNLDSWTQADYVYSGVKTVTASFETINHTVQYLTISYLKDSNTVTQVNGIGSYTLSIPSQYDNYQFVNTDDTSRTFEITKKHLSINWTNLVVEANKNVIEKEYTSSTIGLSKGVDVAIDGAVAGDSINYNLTTQSPATNVGEYLYTLSFNETPLNYDYTNEITSVYLRVIQKVISANLDSLSKEYNGADLSWNASLTGVFANDESNVSASISYDSTPRDAGPYNATISLTGTAASNYVLDSSSSQPIEVTQKEVKVTVKDQTISIGDAISVISSDFDYESIGLLSGDGLTGPASYTVKDALINGNTISESSTSSVEVTYYIFASGLAASSNYYITYVPGKLHYVPNSFDSATIVYGASKYTYNGSLQHPTITSVKVGSDSLVENTDYNITYPSAENGAYINPGTYIVRVSGLNTYSGSHKDFDFVIENAELSVSATAETLTYNGSDQTATLDKTLTTATGESVAYTYSETEYGTYTADLPEYKNAGNYKVYYKANADNYNETSGYFYITINKVNITSYNFVILYDNNDYFIYGNDFNYNPSASYANGVKISENVYEVVNGLFTIASELQVGEHEYTINFESYNQNYKNDSFKKNIIVRYEITYEGDVAGEYDITTSGATGGVLKVYVLNEDYVPNECTYEAWLEEPPVVRNPIRYRVLDKDRNEIGVFIVGVTEKIVLNQNIILVPEFE